MDIAFVFYNVHVLVDIVGASLMGWWIYRLIRADKKPSIFYYCLLLMFLGGLISSGISAYCRWFYILDDFVTYKKILGEFYWHGRIAVNLIADGIVVGVLVHRFWYLKKGYEG